ncbi:MAG: iron-containing alcohol dehydrogenase, partial [Gammaproteobacteria bacterium]|nr:iron-containing alcohol dehydrogenase [Gammaproteobacteria bacterium]
MLDIRPFSLSPLPQIVFGAGVIAQLPELILRFGTRVVLVTGARSFTATPHWRALTETLRAADVQWEVVRITGEPSPQVIDGAVRQCRATGAPYHIVIGIGGGSVLDAGKAIAGLLPSGDSVMNYLEGVGRGLTYRGPALPYIAV